MTNAISFPYTMDVFGNTTATTDVTKIYLDRLLTLLSTNIGQRPILQDYGTDLMRALFENENNLENAVNQAVKEAVSRWIPQMSIEKITVGTVDQEGHADVVISVVLPNDTIASVNISTATFGADGSITR